MVVVVVDAVLDGLDEVITSFVSSVSEQSRRASAAGFSDKSTSSDDMAASSVTVELSVAWFWLVWLL